MGFFITINVSTGGRTFPLTVDVGTTVRGLRQAICELYSRGDANACKLISNARYLGNLDANLQSYGLHNGSEVNAKYNFTGGGHLEVAQELRRVKTSLMAGKLCNLEMVEAVDDWHWNLMVRGPEGTPYARGLFQVELGFPDDFPSSPPTTAFITPIYHPNVYDDGKLCWNSNGNDGEATYSVKDLIGIINVVLEAPNVHSPANRDAALQYTYNRAAFDRIAREDAELHAFY